MQRINLQEKMRKRGEEGKTEIALDEYLLEDSQLSNEARLHYFTFIHILNQFGRIGRNYQCEKLIPKYARVKFFRNKVVEHWDDYYREGHFPHSGFTQRAGKPAIPTIHSVYTVEERVKLGKEVFDFLEQENVMLYLDFRACGLGASEEYCETIYQALEQIGLDVIDNNKGKKYSPLILLLLKLDFPVPITDVEKYSNELVDKLDRDLYSTLTVSPSIPQSPNLKTLACDS
jgi:hypothetical protein